MAHANSSGYYQSPRQYPQQHQHYSHSTAHSYFNPHYALSQQNAPVQLAPGYPQKNYSMAQVGMSGRPPMSSIYMPSSSGAEDYFIASQRPLASSSTPSLSSMMYSGPMTPRYAQHSRSFSATSTSQVSMTAQPSLVVAPAPDRYHRRKSMISLSSASFQETPSHKHSSSASSITPPSNASSASTSTSSSSAMSNQTHSTPLSSASSVPSSPVLSDPRSLKQPMKKDPQVVSTSRKSKPFIATSVSPSPALPPPLVLPSEVRRHSITNVQQSRSKPNSSSGMRVGSSPATSKPVAQTPTRAFHTPLNSNMPAPVKVNASSSTGTPTQPSRPPRRQQAPHNARASVSNPPVPSQPATPQKLSFGKKLRKAFSFGKKKPSDRAATMSGAIQPPQLGRAQPTKTKSMTLTSANINQRHTIASPPSQADFSNFSSVLERPRIPSSTSSLAVDDSSSINSGVSLSSMSRFKRIGNQFGKGTKNIFKSNNQTNLRAVVDSPTAASAATAVVPKAAARAPSGSAVAPPVKVSHVVSDSECATATTTSSTSKTNKTTATTSPVHNEPTFFAGQPDKSAEKNSSGSESDEDLNAADTVFPKNLDSVAVETIRSSLERSKSLERRRSRRSTRSVKSSDSGKRQSSVIPNALEVHVSSSSASISDPDKTKQHTPAHGILKELNKSESNANLGLGLAAASALDPEVKKYKSSLKRPNSSSSIPQSVSPPHMEMIPRAHSSTSISMRRSSRSTTPGAGAAVIGNPGSAVKFSSRIIIYDTYDCVDYDRRAEISTCNRLNPALARQIREELNSFKMEMEVHESSRIFTHFY